MNCRDKFDCPKCGHTSVVSFNEATGVSKCFHCGTEWNTKPKPDPNNPYTEFAKEMSLLHEALKAEGFRDSMVPIMQAIAPAIWSKVELKRSEERWKARHRELRNKSKESAAERFVREVNADNLQRNQETMDAIVKKGLGL